MCIQINRCQKQSCTCSESVAIHSGNLGRSYTSLYHLLSVRSHHPTYTFGALEFLPFYITDISAFSILYIRAKRDLPPNFAGITNILKVILRDGTVYFMVIFCIQLSSLVVPYITTVCVIWCVRRCCAHRDCIFSKQFKSCPQCKFLFLGVGAASG